MPGSATWNADFENKGFSVVHINAAIDFHTFKHEVGHNLGATHDVYTFATVLRLLRWCHAGQDESESDDTCPERESHSVGSLAA